MPTKKKKRETSPARVFGEAQDPVSKLARGQGQSPAPPPEPTSNRPTMLSPDEERSGFTIDEYGQKVAPDGHVFSKFGDTSRWRDKSKEGNVIRARDSETPIEPRGERPISASELAQRQEEMGILAEQVGQIGEIGEIQGSLDPFNEQSLKQGIKGWYRGGLQGAGIGAGAGALIASGVPVVGTGVGAGLGAAGGFIWGAMKGFWNDYSSDIESKATGEVSARKQTLRAAKSDMIRALSNMHGGRSDPALTAEDFNQRLTAAVEGYMQLQADVEQNIDLWLSEDGTTTIQQYIEFFRAGGKADQMIGEMELAVASGPNYQRSMELAMEANLLDIGNLLQ